MKIGLDYHGVIIEPAKRSGDIGQPLDPRRSRHQARTGMFEGVAKLVEVSEGNVWIVSKAGMTMEQRVREWLEAERFYARTGMEPDRVHFCRERQGKAPICEALGITHFVDDRIHLMQILRNVAPHLFLMGQPQAGRFCPPWARFVTCWHELVPLLLEREYAARE